MKLPSHIWHLKGAARGPNVVVLGGTHGDEMTGIELVRRALSRLNLLQKPAGTHEMPGIRGNLFFGFGNPEAMLRRTRGASVERDLNRSFISSELARASHADDSADLRRARELAPLLRAADYLFDIHATSSQSPPFVCFGNDSPAHRKLYRLIPVRHILTDPRTLLGSDMELPELGTTDSCVNGAGGIALCYETGMETDLTKVHMALGVVGSLLKNINAVTPMFLRRIGATPIPKPGKPQGVYALAHCAVAKHAGFAYEPNMHNGWKRVRAGTKLGEYSNGVSEVIPTDGMLLFNRHPDKVRPGRSLYYLADHIDTIAP